MWSVLTYDFDKKVSKEQCLKNSIIKTNPGSIVVFHDSLKSEVKSVICASIVLKHFTEEGYIFKVL